MCSSVGRNRVKPGNFFGLSTRKGNSSSTWGFENGLQYNARSEKLSSTYKGLERGILKTTSFWEVGIQFTSTSEEVFLGVVINKQNEFAILTMDSIPLVAKYHHRMPVVIDPSKINSFYEECELTGLFLPIENIVIKVPLKNVA